MCKIGLVRNEKEHWREIFLCNSIKLYSEEVEAEKEEKEEEEEKKGKKTE